MGSGGKRVAEGAWARMGSGVVPAPRRLRRCGSAVPDVVPRPFGGRRLRAGRKTDSAPRIRHHAGPLGRMDGVVGGDAAMSVGRGSALSGQIGRAGLRPRARDAARMLNGRPSFLLGPVQHSGNFILPVESGGHIGFDDALGNRRVDVKPGYLVAWDVEALDHKDNFFLW